MPGGGQSGERAVESPLDSGENLCERSELEVSITDAVVSTCTSLNIAHDESVIREATRGCPLLAGTSDVYVQFRVAQKADHRGLNWRVEKFADERSALVSEFEGLLTSAAELAECESHTFMTAVAQRFPTCSIAQDFDPLKGLVKLWHFGRLNASDLCAMEEAPRALRRYAEFFQSFDFCRVFCVGIDFSGSMNLYFKMHETTSKDAATVSRMFDGLGLKQPSEERLRFCSGPGSFAMTFRWDAEEYERVCFYIVSGSENAQTHEEVAAFVNATPLPVFKSGGEALMVGAPHNNCFSSISFGRDGATYFKLESDFFNSYYSLLDRCVFFHSSPDRN